MAKANQETLSREEKGRLIAETYPIQKMCNCYKVPSQFGSGTYTVKIDSTKEECDCSDFERRGSKCKHIHAVEYILKNEIRIDKEGNTVITQTQTITYSQNWQAYDKASTVQKTEFLRLLGNLVKNVKEPAYKFGRPQISMQDLVFASALKVYSTFSLRRFVSDLAIARDNNYVSTKPCYASIGHFMQKEEITPILNDLITISSLPLASVETKFAVDSSGFSTCRFARYFSYKHQKDLKYRQWIKAHLSVGVKTNIVTAVRITNEYSNDCPEFKPLIEKTAENFKIEEATADKAYSSRENYNLVNSLGGTAFIPFKEHATDKARGSFTWQRMFHYCQYRREEFMQHYHLRSNVETTNHMIKTKFGDYLRSKSKTAQINELLLKILCHNICVLIQEMFELGINVELDVKK